MEYREEYEQEIDLKDLLFHILYRWRSLVLAAALVCGLAAGYVSYYNGTTLPAGRRALQVQMEEQKHLMEGLEEGESPEAIQKQITQLQEELAGLVRLSYAKYCGMGFAGAVLALAFLYGLSYVCSDKLRGERELRERYGYYLLGTFPRGKRKGPFKFVDRYLERLEGVSEQITLEEAYWIISINIINLAKTGGTFLVTGTVDVERLQKFVDVVSLQVENVTLTVGANMNATASTLEALAECDAVILVEERNKSLRAKIHKEYESIAALEKPVVGYVVL